MIHKALFTFIITNMVFAENDISVDLAYQLVLEKINKKAVPVSFLNDVFKSSSIKKHMEIPERFACLLYTSPSPRDATLSRMPSSA